MENDEYDNDEELCRRTEFIETREMGTLHARCVGDSDDPLILYLHSSEEGATSASMNSLVTTLAEVRVDVTVGTPIWFRCCGRRAAVPDPSPVHG